MVICKLNAADSVVHDGYPSIAMNSICLDKQKSKVRADPAEDFLKTYGNAQLHPVDNHDLRRTLVELKQENKDLKEENTKWKDMVLQGITAFNEIVVEPYSY